MNKKDCGFSKQNYHSELHASSGVQAIELVRISLPHLECFGPGTCQKSLDKIAKLRFADQEEIALKLLDRLLECKLDRPSVYSSALYDCVKMNLSCREIALELLERFVIRIAKANSLDCALVLKACSKQQILKGAALQAVLERFEALLPNASVHSCAKVLWALMAFEMDVSKLALKVANRFCQLVKTARAKDCSAVLHACGHFGISDRHLILTIVKRFVGFRWVSSRDSASCLLSLVHLGVFDRQHSLRLVALFRNELESAYPVDVTKVLRACAWFRLKDCVDLYPLVERFVELLPQADRELCASVLNSCSKLDVGDVDHLLEILVHYLNSPTKLAGLAVSLMDEALEKLPEEVQEEFLRLS